MLNISDKEKIECDLEEINTGFVSDIIDTLSCGDEIKELVNEFLKAKLYDIDNRDNDE